MIYLLFMFTNDFQWFSTTGGVTEHSGDLARQQHWKYTCATAEKNEVF